MIQVSNLRVDPKAHDGSERAEGACLRRAVGRRLRVRDEQITSLEIRRRSIDARKRDSLHFLYTVRITLVGGANAERTLLDRLRGRHDDRGVTLVQNEPQTWTPRTRKPLDERVVVVGAGCAGLFCALELAHAGLEPLLVERGDDATRRTDAVERFNATGELDPESNIQFGVGGAGTFSDGKLATGTKSKLHRLILETFVDAGAGRDILWDSHPHVGSDVLPRVVDDLCRQIRDLGGEVRCRCRMTDLDASDGRVRAVTLETRDAETGLVIEERVPTSHVVLACGHSARDVFELLARRGVTLERKTFAMGVRIEHLQADIDRAQYGRFAGLPSLGASPYKLVSHLPNGRSAFSFCMCPGGYVVAAASEPGHVVTNGMSLAARDGRNANSGLLANVRPEDLPGDDPLAGVRLQRECEARAFELGGGGFAAPAQLVGDFLSGATSSAGGRVEPTYPRGVAWGSVEPCLPDYVADTLRAAIPDMAHRLHGFDASDAVLTGIESRSSSPVRVTRGETCESVSCQGLWVAGEGAGYAGGIMSAATDGIRVARALTATLDPGSR